MARIVDGPEITGQVVHKQTGQAYGPVTVAVTPKVYTDREMTASVTSLTTDGTGVFSCYAPPGTYTFSTTAVDSQTIEPVEVLGREGGTGVATAASGVTGGAAWLTGTSYSAGAIVTQGGVNYECAVAHTSGVFATDLAAGKWIETGVNSAASSTLSNTAAVDLAAAAASGTATSASRQDHVHRSLGLLSLFWGDSSDGTAVLDGTNTFSWASKSGSTYTLSRDVHLASLTVNAGSVLVTNDYLINAAAVVNNGSINNNGTSAVASAAVSASGGSHFQNRRGQGAGGTGAGTVGAATGVGYINGGAGGAGSGGAGGSASNPQAGLSPLYGTATGGSILHSFLTLFTGTVQVQAVNPASVQPILSSSGNGGNGGGDTTNSGGTGGQGGGSLIVNARVLTGNGVFACNGGNGGTPAAGNCGGGGGGAGGICIVNTTDATGWSGTVTAAFGTGGTPTGTGVAGSNGNAGFTKLTTWS